MIAASVHLFYEIRKR